MKLSNQQHDIMCPNPICKCSIRINSKNKNVTCGHCHREIGVRYYGNGKVIVFLVKHHHKNGRQRRKKQAYVNNHGGK